MIPAKEVTFPVLWSEIGGGSRFTPDQIESMMSDCLDTKEPFLMIHNNKAYIIPLREIELYFVDHARPEKRQAASEEIDELRRRLDAMSKELELAKRTTLNIQGVAAQHVVNPTPESAVFEGSIPTGDFQSDLAAELAKVKKPKPINKAL